MVRKEERGSGEGCKKGTGRGRVRGNEDVRENDDGKGRMGRI